MAAVIDNELAERLRNTEGFLVESVNGPLGWVEELWLGAWGEPRALAVRTGQGRRALLLGEHVRAVDRDRHWVVVDQEPALLELDAPRLASAGTGDGQITASWSTTGATLGEAPPWRPPRAIRLGLARFPKPAAEAEEWPLWQLVAVLYVGIALVAMVMMTLAFLIPWLVTGTAY